MSHWLGCVFYVLAYRLSFANEHFADAPWKPLHLDSLAEEAGLISEADGQ